MATAPNPSAPTTPEDPWSIPVGSATGDYVLCPPGNYPGTIVAVLDIGHQSVPRREGGSASVHKLVIAFELARPARPDGRPFVLAESYTWSLKENSNLYSLICGLVGRKLREGESYSPRALLGGPCMVNVTNSMKGDLTYHQINTVSQFPDGYPPPRPTHRPLAWRVQDGEPFPALDWLPPLFGRSIADLVAESAEARRRGATLAGPDPAGDHEIPF